MMSQKFHPYLQALTKMPHGSEKNCCVAAAAIAMVVANSLDVPSAPVSAEATHFAVTHGMQARDIIGQFNEAAVLDIPMALDFAKKFWCLRYRNVHQGQMLNSGEGCFFEVYTGATMIFSPTEIKFLNDYAADIMKMFLIIRDVFTGVKKEQQSWVG